MDQNGCFLAKESVQIQTVEIKGLTTMSAAEAPAAPCVHSQQSIYKEDFKTKSLVLPLLPHQ